MKIKKITFTVLVMLPFTFANASNSISGVKLAEEILKENKVEDIRISRDCTNKIAPLNLAGNGYSGKKMVKIISDCVKTLSENEIIYKNSANERIKTRN